MLGGDLNATAPAPTRESEIAPRHKHVQDDNESLDPSEASINMGQPATVAIRRTASRPMGCPRYFAFWCEALRCMFEILYVQGRAVFS
jgi:hypothetical protein